MAEMEAELTSALIERGRHGAFLTPIGEEVARRARLILSAVEDLKAVTRETASGLAGRLRLGVLPSIGPYLLPNATKRLHAQFPHLRLLVREEKTVDLEMHLMNGQFDVIISTAENHSLHSAIPLFEESFWACAAPDDPLSQSKEPLPLNELKNRSLLTLGHGHQFSQDIIELAHKVGAHVNEEYLGTSLDAIRQMAVMGAGVAILPSLYARLEAQRDRDITVRPLIDPSAQRTISLIWRNQSPLADKFVAVSEVLRQTAIELLTP